MQKTHLGIVLAGAVTAGAFTAGVMDYIINTLHLWEGAYQKDPEHVPEPNVVLDVLTGASAGSIAAAVTTLGLATDNLPFVADIRDRNQAEKNILFDTWVNLGLGKNDVILDTLFSLSDLKAENQEEEELRSLLNTSFIENMMSKLIEKVQTSEKVSLPSFINPDLEILMTLSNLRGLPIDMYFSSDDRNVGHTMSYHKAYALFQFGKMNNDADAEKLKFNINDDNDLKIFLNCARASGAFPVGLQSIPIKHISPNYIHANIKRLFGDNANIKPRINDKEYEFLAVDGGMTNNEPLAEALKSLKTSHDNYKMILIDPFPSHIPDEEAPYDVDKNSVFDLIGPLFKTLRNQAIFKESDIVDLFSDDTHKHMIWPTRYDAEHNALKNAIACGALSGFSGFLNREFRLHDYQLGQKNAQNFLRHYFRKKITDEETYSPEFIETFGIESKDGDIELPIIPDFSIESRDTEDGFVIFNPSLEDNLMDFPGIHIEPVVNFMEPKLKKRVKKIVAMSFDKIKKTKKTVDENTHPLIIERNKKTLLSRLFSPMIKGIGNLFMRAIGKRLLEKTISNRIIDTMIEELDEYQLIHK